MFSNLLIDYWPDKLERYDEGCAFTVSLNEHPGYENYIFYRAPNFWPSALEVWVEEE